MILPKLRSKLDAQDIAQESYVSFFQKINDGLVEWNEEGDLWKLLAGIARKKVLKQAEFYGAEKRSIRREIQQVNQATTVAESHESCVDLTDLIEHVLSEEKSLFRDIFLQRLAGHSTHEIATRIGRSERTCRRILESLKTKLRLQYENEIHTQPNNRAAIDLPQNGQGAKEGQISVELEDANFILIRMVGQGTFGKVYFSHSTTNTLPPNFAVKVLRKNWHGNRKAIQGFRSEIYHQHSLNHPSIAQFFGAGQLRNGSPFFAMEYVPFTLKDVSAHSHVDAEMLIRQLCSTVSFLHESNLSHGDLKESNIGLTKDGTVKVLDFGFTEFINCPAPTSTESDIIQLKRIIRNLTKQLGARLKPDFKRRLLEWLESEERKIPIFESTWKSTAD